MPALHIVGEIVGASGLRPHDALSVAHWLDVLSLHPSSKRGFFCRWHLNFRAFDTATTTDPDNNKNKDGGSWRVLQGASRGQTQVHAWSPITVLEGQHVTTSSRRQPSRDRDEQDDQDDPDDENDAPRVELETLWCHPIDLHLAVRELLGGHWPFLELEVWSLDEFDRERLVGTAATPLPLAQHEFFLDLPITILARPSAIEAVTDWLDLQRDAPHDDRGSYDHEDDDGDDPLVATSIGAVFVRLAVVQQGVFERGVRS